MAGLLVALLVLVAAGAGAWWVTRPHTTRTAATPRPTCAGPRQSAQVVVTPALAGVVGRAATRVSEQSPCLTLELTSAESSTVAQTYLGDATRPDAWVSDSDVWTTAVRTAHPDRLAAQTQTLAVSPMVLAVPDVVVSTVRSDVDAATWASVLTRTSRLPVTLPDPETSTSGRLLLLAGSGAIEAKAGRPGLASQLMAWAHTTMPTTAELFESLSSAAPRVFPTSEQSVSSFRADHPGLVTAVVPPGGTPAYAYTLATSSGLTAEASAAVSALGEELTSDLTRSDLAAAGFRGDASSEGRGVAGVVPSKVTYAALPPSTQQSVTYATWQAVRTDSRMLALLDTSASMGEKVGASTRIGLVTAAARRAVGLLPGSAELGSWEFGQDKGGPGVDWTELSPIEQLDTYHGGTSHRQDASDVLTPLAGRVAGGTALYNTVLAAYQTMRSSYDPQRVNSVVVLTDGKNDAPDGLSLEQLLAKLKQLRDPDRPVLVVTVGMGPDADAEALRAISAATGAKSYLARDPADIDHVFLDAILSRSCTATGCTG